MLRKPSYRLQVETLESRIALSTYYVAPTGADSAAGSALAPWATLQRAANLVKPGDTVLVQPGNYTGFYLRTSGTSTAPIAFQAQPGVTITQHNPTTNDGINLEGASYITVKGFTVVGMPRAGIRSVTNNHVTIVNNVCDSNNTWGIFTGFTNYADIENNVCSRSAVQHGIYVSNSCVNPIIRNNECWGNYACGIHMNGDLSMGGTGLITGALVTGNVVHDNGAGGGSGINCDGVQNSTIANNVLYNNHSSGISLYRANAAAGSKNDVIANNTIVMASNARWVLNIQNTSTGATVFNNILYDNNSTRGSVDISSDSLPGFTSDSNVVMNRFTTNGGSTMLTLSQWQTKTGQDKHSLLATPAQLFVNVAGNDYHLASTSPAIDRGISSLAGHAAPTTDRDGKARPSGAGYDIGAYELQKTAPAVATFRSSSTGSTQALDWYFVLNAQKSKDAWAGV